MIERARARAYSKIMQHIILFQFKKKKQFQFHLWDTKCDADDRLCDQLFLRVIV